MKRDIILKDIVKLCNGQMLCGNLEAKLDNFCIDTRNIQKGDIYVGIKGENTDGNKFYKEALDKGASVCILEGVNIDKDVLQQYADKSIIIVDDVVKTLQKLALLKRNMYDIPVVAITGSVGKTSTKDIVASVMAKKFNVLKTEGNFNSQIGLALTILRLKDHTAMVLEMGMNHFGELRILSNIARPTVAVITNIGTSHIGILGSRDNILKAKLEILEGLEEDGKIVINNDNDLLHSWYLNSNIKNITTYGMESKSNIVAHNANLLENGSTYKVDINQKTYDVNINVGGNHFVLNSLCAIAVGNLFNIPMESILEGISNFELTKRRMQIEKKENNITIINDCYNASYDSMKAAIEYLAKLSSGLKIAVLGDMLELGEYSENLHRKVGEEVGKNNIDVLITVGEESKYIVEQAKKFGMKDNNIYEYDNNSKAIVKLKELMKNGNVNILIKASNSMNFQEIFDDIMK